MKRLSISINTMLPILAESFKHLISSELFPDFAVLKYSLDQKYKAPICFHLSEMPLPVLFPIDYQYYT